jgi:GT2 family glycosyltransferase
MNAGIAATDADIIVRLDGHCRPAPDYIERCLAALALPDAGVAGGVWKIEPGAPGLTARAIAAVLSHPLASGGADYRQPPRATDGGARAVDTVPFGAFRRELWERLGGFDESLLRNQDYDFNYRVRLTGLDVILDPSIVSVYKARATFSALARQYFDYGFWKVVMLRKFPASIRLRQLLPLLLVPVIAALAAWALISESWLPLAPIAVYAALNLVGATQASWRAGDARLIPAATMALLTLQSAWSAGAWVSLLRGARAPER